MELKNSNLFVLKSNYISNCSRSIRDEEKKNDIWDFPGGPVVKTLCCHYRGHSSVVKNPPSNAGDKGSIPS